MSIYKNPKYTTNQRVDDLLSQMTLEEKIAQLGAQWLILDHNGDHQDRELEMAGQGEKKSIPERLKHGLGQITRPLGTHNVDVVEGVKALNKLQKYMVEETRLGIPVMSHEECLVGLMAKGATLFPSSLNYGHTWDPELIEKMGKEIGKQVRKVGAHHGLAPVLDVSRDVRWGRTEETLGEDPYHVGLLATHYVKGLQGEKRDILATLKHYVGHSFSEGARNHAPVHLGFKELNDIFMLPFEMAVKLGNAGSVMPAYHDIDNEPCHSSHYLLTEVLRDQWGFDGLIVADYGGIELLASHHGVAKDNAEAMALSLNAGLDIELPDDACGSYILSALERGLITIEKLDEIVARILTMKFKLGLFEHPYCSEEVGVLNSEEAKTLAYQVALQSIVLLENHNNTLPLDVKNRIAVVGPTADDQLALLGGYSFPVHLILSSMNDGEKVSQTILEAVKAQFDEVLYHKGCDILTERHANAPVFPGDVDMAINQELLSPVSQDSSDIKQAMTVINQADVALVCVGDLAGLFQTGTVGEGSDSDSLDLPGVQQQLVDAAIATGKPVIILVTGGRPYNLNGAEEKAAAVLMGWAPGQEGARAIVDVITGVQLPSGRLTLSIPKNVGAVPYYYNHKLKSGGTPIAYHFGSKYPFGYGLTYTQFDYLSMQIENNQVPIDGRVKVRVTIKNRGDRDGCEVVQLYVRDTLCSLVRPIRELKGFYRAKIRLGDTVTTEFDLPVDMLNFTNHHHQRVVEAGEFEIMVGKSATDIQCRETITVVGETRVLPKYWDMVCRVSCN